MDNIYQEITKYSKTLMLKEPFYGLFLISLNKELSKSIPTACVTPENINTKLVVNPDFWETLDEKTKMGVLKHELLHIAFFHLNNFDRFPDKKLYNVAADLEINQYIGDEMKGETWDGLEIDKEPFAPLNLKPKQGTEYYYKALQEEIEKNPNGDIADLVASLDGNIHELWEAMGELGEAERNLIAKQVDYQLKEIAEELEKRSRDRGLIPAEMKDYIDSLFEIQEPVIDWASYLRRFNSMSTMTYTKKTRRKYNKRFPSNPALKIKPKKHVLVGIDTSGSVSDKDILEFFNEINHMYKTGITITIAEGDAAVHNVYEYEGKVPETVTGRGGTDMNPFVKYFNENRKYNSLIVLTDGFIPERAVNSFKPMLMVLSSNGSSIEEVKELNWGNIIKIQ